MSWALTLWIAIPACILAGVVFVSLVREARHTDFSVRPPRSDD